MTNKSFLLLSFLNKIKFFYAQRLQYAKRGFYSWLAAKETRLRCVGGFDPLLPAPRTLWASETLCFVITKEETKINKSTFCLQNCQAAP